MPDSPPCSTLHLHQPEWVAAWLQRPPPAANDHARLTEVLALARENVERTGGGPFAAAVYTLAGNERLSAAVNTTVDSHCSAAHAELQALSLAQQRGGSHVLEAPCILVSSSAPCTMCLGATAWSGVRALLYATSREDVEAIGFDEGPATPHWQHELTRRGIAVRGPLLRREGQAILRLYVELGGMIYNGPAHPPEARGDD